MAKFRKQTRKVNEYTKVCLYCSNEFICYNRSRKFCPDSNCHDCFHNNRKLEVYHRNKVLVEGSESNREIIECLLKENKLKVSKAKLNEMNFNFDLFIKHYFTALTISRGNGDLYEYNDFFLKNLGDGWLEILKPKTNTHGSL